MASLTVKRQQTWHTRASRFLADQRRWSPYLFIAPFFITFAVFTLYPMLCAIAMAFQESLGYSNQWQWVGLANFQEALTDDTHLRIAFQNVVLYILGSIVTQLPVAFGLALLLTSRRMYARNFLRVLFYIPVALPGVTMGVVGMWFFNAERGFANALLHTFGAEPVRWMARPDLVLPMMLVLAFWQYIGSHTVFLIAGLTSLDQSVLEAATVDGANGWQRVRHIILPLLRPVLIYISITMTAGSLIVYETSILLFPGSGSGPAGQGWFFLPYITWLAFDQFRLGYATAIGWLVFLLAIGLSAIQLKLFRFGEED
jgi:ABC-type sugar transport system permease subunit